MNDMNNIMNIHNSREYNNNYENDIRYFKKANRNISK